MANCQERDRLFNEWNARVAEHAEALGHLAKKSGMLPKPQYDGILLAVESLRRQAESAQTGYLNHRRDHGC
jgi:hypothetical protein